MRILFPTDFSNAAENAFVFALKLAKQLSAHITVVHIYRVPEISPWAKVSGKSDEMNDIVTLDEFDQFKSEIGILKRIASENHLSDIDINYSLRESEQVVPAIIKESDESRADIIIMGTTGASGLKEMLFGSVASKIMEAARCPVLLVPEKAFYKGILRIGMAINYRPEEKDLVNQALEITKKFGAHLYCFHVNVVDQNKMKELTNQLHEEFENEYDISFHNYYSLDQERGILDYCKDEHMDMLVMRVRYHNRFREMISYNLAKKVAYHIQIPLLTFHGEPIE